MALKLHKSTPVTVYLKILASGNLERSMAKRSTQSGDTSLHLGDSDTDTLELFEVGKRVRVAAGPVKGVVGTVKEIRDGSHVLLQLEHGVYVIVAKFMVQSLGSQ